MRTGTRIGLAGVALAAAFVAGWLLGSSGRTSLFRSYAIREGQQDFLNPLLECELDDTGQGGELRHFGVALYELAETIESRPNLGRVGVYFRAMNNGMWLGRREREGFIPASLGKVPIVLACLRQAQENPGFLARSVRYEGLPAEKEPGFMNPEVNLEIGGVYTVSDLIRRVGTYSDNASARLLASLVDPTVQAAVNVDLGLPNADAIETGAQITPKQYGSIFRVLFNASYVGRPLSRFALDAFARSTFELGLVAGVPEGTVVSHKFGVWEGGGSEEPLQLHDCGIVYYRPHPYLLCVMTTGSNYVDMSAAITEISRFVYGRVEAESISGTLRAR